MILGEIGKTSPFYLQKGFIPSNSTLVVAILAVFVGRFTLQVGRGAVRCSAMPVSADLNCRDAHVSMYQSKHGIDIAKLRSFCLSWQCHLETKMQRLDDKKIIPGWNCLE